MENTKLASDQQRISNLVIDTIIVYFVYAFLVNVLGVTGWLVYLAVFTVYYLAFELTLKRTIGKFITKTRVVSDNGSLPRSSAIILRTVFRCIPFEIFSFLGSKNPTGWHDSLSNTRVEKI